MSNHNFSQTDDNTMSSKDSDEYVTMTVAGQLFGIPVLKVQDVLGSQKLARIPLAPPEVAGSLNLRGRIVTAIDVRIRLDLPPRPADMHGMSVVVYQGDELYSLLIDQVGEVLSLPRADFEPNPPTLEPRWRELSTGIYRLDGKLMVVIDIDRLLNLSRSNAA
jgi:purine-binding chemotaxis protein CheW